LKGRASQYCGQSGMKFCEADKIRQFAKEVFEHPDQKEAHV